MKMRSLFLCLLFGSASAAFAGSVEEGPRGATLEELISIGREEATLPAAIDRIGARLLGTPYLLGNAGEGSEDVYDQDPRWRLDAQDCTTYVETVMASALSANRAAFLRTLDRIRYEGGRVSFRTRNHFPEVDWLPNNARAGFVRDITAEVFPEEFRAAHGNIDKSIWYGKMSANSIEPSSRPLAERERLAEQLREFAPEYRPEPYMIAYLPMALFFERGADGELRPNQKLLSRIPHATIFNITREGWSPGGIPMSISHQGFILQKTDGTYMRHASPGRGVVEDRLDLYFQKFLSSPTIRGINLLEILDPSAEAHSPVFLR